MTITPERLEAHSLWLTFKPGGVRLNLFGAYLRRANLRRAVLRSADLRNADLRGADLSDADLRDANLSGANLSGADLRDADLRRAVLSDADLRDADLSDANLSDANLSDADLRDADLSGADLYGANLTGADLRGTCVELLLDNDGRWYQVVAHRGLLLDDETVYLAGCRKLTYATAVAHWSDPGHAAPESAAKILAVIEAHHTRTAPEGN